MTEPTLHEALAAKGITSERDENTVRTGRRVLRNADGEVIGRFDVHEAWAGLAAGTFDTCLITDADGVTRRLPFQIRVF
jgi:hypothetical protein